MQNCAHRMGTVQRRKRFIAVFFQIRVMALLRIKLYSEYNRMKYIKVISVFLMIGHSKEMELIQQLIPMQLQQCHFLLKVAYSQKSRVENTKKGSLYEKLTCAVLFFFNLI